MSFVLSQELNKCSAISGWDRQKWHKLWGTAIWMFLLCKWSHVGSLFSMCLQEKTRTFEGTSECQNFLTIVWLVTCCCSRMVVCKCLYVEATENGFEGFHIQASAESFNVAAFRTKMDSCCNNSSSQTNNWRLHDHLHRIVLSATLITSAT